MMTFYIVGVIIVLLLSLTILAWEIVNGEVYESEMPTSLIGIFIFSLFSWAILFLLAILFVFQYAKNKRKKK